MMSKNHYFSNIFHIFHFLQFLDFKKKTNIFEISKDVYQSYLANPFWTVASIPWRITGPIDAIIDEDIKKSDKGVRLSNTNAIFLVRDKMPRLALYLPDLIQFHISRRKTS